MTGFDAHSPLERRWSNGANPGAWRASAQRLPRSDGWRTFEVTTRIEVLKPSGTTRVWMPTALLIDTPYQKTIANTFDAHQGIARLIDDRAKGLASNGLGIITAEYPTGTSPTLYAHLPDRHPQLPGRLARTGERSQDTTPNPRLFPSSHAAAAHGWCRQGNGARDHQVRTDGCREGTGHL